MVPHNDLDSFRGYLLIGSIFFSLIKLFIWDLSFSLANFFFLQYELADLKHMCLCQLVKNLHPENAAKALMIADRYDKDYKDCIMKYVSK